MSKYAKAAPITWKQVFEDLPVVGEVFKITGTTQGSIKTLFLVATIPYACLWVKISANQDWTKLDDQNHPPRLINRKGKSQIVFPFGAKKGTIYFRGHVDLGEIEKEKEQRKWAGDISTNNRKTKIK